MHGSDGACGKASQSSQVAWPDKEKVQDKMYELVDTLMVHGVGQKWFSSFAQVEGAEEMVTTQGIRAVSWCSLFCVSVVPF